MKRAPAELESLQVDALADMKRAKETDYLVPIHIDLTTVMCMIAAMQLASRHPGNKGPNRKICQQVIREMIARMRGDGFRAAAMLAELGDDPEYDV